MKVYIVQIKETKLAYPSLEKAQAALFRYIQDNLGLQIPNNGVNYQIYPVDLMAANYIAILIHKKTDERSFIKSNLGDTLEEFEEFIEMEYSKDYHYDIVPYFCL